LGPVSTTRTVPVPPARVPRWFDNFRARHGAVELSLAPGGRLRARGVDGAVAEAALPFGREYDGPCEVAAFTDAATFPVDWGILLVRKGGFAVATLRGTRVVTSKVGQRHVQGRTRAGGQSQQRFARRRDNQARQAYEAAAAHAHRVLLLDAPVPLRALMCGGDRSAVDTVLADPRLERLSVVRTEPWLAVPDPRRAVLEQAVVDGSSVQVRVTEPD
jgi:hypothetical protein